MSAPAVATPTTDDLEVCVEYTPPPPTGRGGSLLVRWKSSQPCDNNAVNRLCTLIGQNKSRVHTMELRRQPSSAVPLEIQITHFEASDAEMLYTKLRVLLLASGLTTHDTLLPLFTEISLKT